MLSPGIKQNSALKTLNKTLNNSYQKENLKQTLISLMKSYIIKNKLEISFKSIKLYIFILLK